MSNINEWPRYLDWSMLDKLIIIGFEKSSMNNIWGKHKVCVCFYPHIPYSVKLHWIYIVIGLRLRVKI